jgi:hypothetical protein
VKAIRSFDGEEVKLRHAADGFDVVERAFAKRGLYLRLIRRGTKLHGDVRYDDLLLRLN